MHASTGITGRFGAANLRRGMPRFQAENIGHNLALVDRLKSILSPSRGFVGGAAQGQLLGSSKYSVLPVPAHFKEICDSLFGWTNWMSRVQHVGLQARVLNRQQVGIRVRFVVVGVPPTRWCPERRGIPPVGADGVDDVSLLVEALAQQRVTTRLAVDNQVQGRRLVMVRQLDGAGRQHPVHGPERRRDGFGLGEILVGQQHADAVARGGPGIVLDLLEFPVFVLVPVQRRLESRRVGSNAQVGQQRCVVDPVESGIGLGTVLAEPTGRVKRSCGVQEIASPFVSVRPLPRMTKKSWDVALTVVATCSPGVIRMKLAHRLGLVAGAGHLS